MKQLSLLIICSVLFLNLYAFDCVLNITLIGFNVFINEMFITSTPVVQIKIKTEVILLINI